MNYHMNSATPYLSRLSLLHRMLQGELCEIAARGVPIEHGAAVTPTPSNECSSAKRELHQATHAE